MWATAICVIVAFNCVCCIVIETPQNALVFVGQTTSFKCKTTNGSFLREWQFSNRSLGSNSLKIFSNWNTLPPKLINSDRYNVDVDEFGSGVLYLNDTQLEDTGTYTCLVENGSQLITYSAELIVLASDLKCDSSAGDNSLSTDSKKENKDIWCNISYSGNLIPSVTWFRNDHKITLPTESSDIRLDRIKWFYFNTTFHVNSSDNGMVFSCEIHFEPKNTDEANSITKRVTNIPGRKFTACILKDPRNISTEPDVPGKAGKADWKHIGLSLVFAVLALSAGVALVSVIRSKGLRLKHFHCTDGSIPDIVQQVDNARTEHEEQHFNSPHQRQPPIYAQVDYHVSATSSTIKKSKVEQQQQPRALVEKVNPEEESLYYLDLNGAKGGLSHASRTIIPPRHYYNPEFNQSEYASIDHTQQPPPPLMKKSKQ